MKDDIVIVSAVRTPVGAFNGAFATLPAHELGKVAVQESLKRAGVEPADVSEVILGQILTAGQGQNPAISFAGRACARSRSGIRPFSPGIPKSLSPADKNP